MFKFGVDIGGTTIKIGAFEDGILVDKYEIKTNLEHGGIYIFEDIAESILKYLKEKDLNGDSVIGFGFGVPGKVINNYIYNCPNLGLKNFDIEKEMNKYFPDKIFVSSNDANYAALGEMSVTNYKSTCFITLGTGVGGGIILKNKLIVGVNGAAGEIGHIHIDDVHNYPCTCGLSGCLETISSATGIVRLYKEYSKISNENGVITAKYIFDKVMDKDLIAVKVVDEAMECLAKVLAGVAVTIDPEIFIIGGGVASAGDIIIEKVKYYYKKYAHYAVRDTDIVLAKLKNDAGIYGAMFAI